MNDIQYIQLSKLAVSQENARRVAPESGADDELICSIAQNGLLQNLVVSPGEGPDQYLIHAGGRRYRALMHLLEAGKIDEGFLVPCKVEMDPGKVAEFSLAENTIRKDMHVVDALEAFHRLNEEKGYSDAQIAAHFGKDLREVKRILALGACAPELLEKCRAGEIDVDVLRAFTLTSDHARQLEVYEGMKAENLYMSDFNVRRRLVQESVKASSPLAKFVGRKAYEAAGGTFQEDLFEENIYFLDGSLLRDLAFKKAETAKAELGEEWNWSEINFDLAQYEIDALPRVQGEPTEKTEELESDRQALVKDLDEVQEQISDLDEDEEIEDDEYRKKLGELEGKADSLEQQIEDLDAAISGSYSYTKDAMSNGGMIVTLDSEGNLQYHRGVQSEEQAKSAKKEKAKNDPDAEAKPKYTPSLLADLEVYKSEVARLALIKNPALAVELLHYSIVAQVLRDYVQPMMDVRLGKHPAQTSKNDIATAAARVERIEALEQLRNDVPGEFLDYIDVGDYWLAFNNYAQWPDLLKLQALGHAVAASLHVDNEISGQLMATCHVELRKYWSPTKDNFFGRINKDTCLEIAGHVLGSTAAEPLKDLPKKDLAIRLEEECEEGKPGQDWIPDPMVTRSLVVEEANDKAA